MEDLAADGGRERRVARRRARRDDPRRAFAGTDAARRRRPRDDACLVRAGVDAVDLVGDLVRRPDGAAAERDPVHPQLEGDAALGDRRIAGDAPEAPVERICDPDRAGADRESTDELRRQLDAPRHDVPRGVDLRDPALLDDPDVALTRRDQLRLRVDPRDDAVRSRVDPRDRLVGLTTQTASGVTASFCRLKPPMPEGWPPGAGGRSMVPTTTPDAGSIRDTLSGKSLSPSAARPVADPDGARTRGDVGRPRRRAEDAPDVVRLGVDLGHRLVVAVEDPDAALPDGDARRGRAEGDRLPEVAGFRVEHDRPGALVRLFPARQTPGSDPERDGEERGRRPPRYAHG